MSDYQSNVADSNFFMDNADYIREMYAAFCQDPSSVSSHWQARFSGLNLAQTDAAIEARHAQVRQAMTQSMKAPRSELAQGVVSAQAPAGQQGNDKVEVK